MHQHTQNFGDFGLSEATMTALLQKGFTQPTPIQGAAIPLLLGTRQDMVGQAGTGTGKTAAFGIPIMEMLSAKQTYPQALILVPTRELALQVADELHSLKGSQPYRITAIYGGQSYQPQLRALKQGSHIIVGTPGRIMDHIERRTLVLDRITHVVLDEADEMLNQGFQEDIESILSGLPKGRRTMLFSATMPKRILQLAETFMGSYEHVVVKPDKDTPASTAQSYIELHEKDKLDALTRIIDSHHDFYGLVFCRTKIDTDRTAQALQRQGYPAQALHGDISQAMREQILRGCREGRTRILVATDVAARGIDIPELTHVINYALPQDPESYLHRIGRTGRAGKTGIAVSLVTPTESRKLSYYRHALKLDIQKQSLPSVKRIIRKRRQELTAELQEIIQAGSHGELLGYAQQLVESQDPSALVASLLHHASRQDLCASHYREISEPKPSSSYGGRQTPFPQNRRKQKFRGQRKSWKYRAS